MRPFLLIVMLTVLSTVNVCAQGPELDFDQENFNGQFCVAAIAFEYDNYYVTNLTEFSSRMERIYFLNLVYKENKIVNIDAGIDNDQMWFKSHDANTEEEIICLMNDLRDQSKTEVKTFTEKEKEAWLEKHDKFSKAGNRE